VTPSIRLSFFSIRDAQDAHVMPPIASSIRVATRGRVAGLSAEPAVVPAPVFVLVLMTCS
jgi:hypothetical protein